VMYKMCSSVAKWDRYQNIRASILDARPKGRGRIQISAELPLLYPTGAVANLAKFCFHPMPIPQRAHIVLVLQN
jgi:hypothetical protein